MIVVQNTESVQSQTYDNRRKPSPLSNINDEDADFDIEEDKLYNTNA